MGIFGTMNALSMAITPAAGISIYQLTNHRTAFFIAAVTASLALIIVQFVKTGTKHLRSLPNEACNFLIKMSSLSRLS